MQINFVINNRDIIKKDIVTIKELSCNLGDLKRKFPTSTIDVKIGNLKISGLVVKQ